MVSDFLEYIREALGADEALVGPGGEVATRMLERLGGTKIWATTFATIEVEAQFALLDSLAGACDAEHRDASNEGHVQEDEWYDCAHPICVVVSDLLTPARAVLNEFGHALAEQGLTIIAEHSPVTERPN